MDGRDPPRVGGSAVGGEEGPQALIVPFAISCRDEHVRRLPDRLGPGPPEKTLRPGAPFPDHTRAVQLDARLEVRSVHDDGYVVSGFSRTTGARIPPANGANSGPFPLGSAAARRLCVVGVGPTVCGCGKLGECLMLLSSLPRARRSVRAGGAHST